jgi:membrane associated rhomboid family serine protease
VKWLLLTNLAVFVAYFLSARTAAEALFYPLGLVPSRVVGSLWIWQPFTYLFLHSPFDFWHILFNMLALWMFGGPLEQTWGTRKFLKYYFVTGVGAGLFVVLAHIVVGDLAEAPRVIGASGAIFGLILAFGVVFAETTVLFSFLFPIKAKYMAMIFGGIAFLSSIRPMGDKVSNVAHLGGMLCGFLYLKPDLRWTSPAEGWRRQYREWRFQRAKKKFQVYLKKQNKHDHTIH